MFLMYVDESGDCGTTNSKSEIYILTGIVFHESVWQRLHGELLDLRRVIFRKTGLRIRNEIHTQKMVNGRLGENMNISRNDRFMILRSIIDWLAKQDNVRVITIVVDKQNKKDTDEIFKMAWSALLQRFENTIKNKNFPSMNQENSKETGLIISDITNEHKLRGLARKMRKYNPIPNLGGEGYRDIPLENIIEDPFMKDSTHSYFIQIADVCAYFALQLYKPNKIVKKQGAKEYFKRLKPILLKEASKRHPLGIVEL